MTTNRNGPDAIRNYYVTSYANPGRGAYTLSV